MRVGDRVTWLRFREDFTAYEARGHIHFIDHGGNIAVMEDGQDGWETTGAQSLTRLLRLWVSNRRGGSE